MIDRRKPLIVAMLLIAFLALVSLLSSEQITEKIKVEEVPTNAGQSKEDKVMSGKFPDTLVS